MLSQLFYSLLWVLALPFVAIRLLLRGRRQAGYLANLGERFGRYAEAANAPVIWIHAVSVGETRAAEPLVRALLARWPGHRVLITHMTPTGRETSATLFAGEPRVSRCYLPYDLGVLCASFLRHFKPEVGIIMETELWPNLLRNCRLRGVPVLLANARLSERSAKRYARWPALSRMTLGALTATGAQTAMDAKRLEGLGAGNVTVTGNIKFDIAPPESQISLGEDFRRRLGDRPVVLAASTREGEEAPVLDAFLARAPKDALLVLVPRHPQRFHEVAALVEGRGLMWQARSDGKAVASESRVWLGDSMGEMFAYYAAADVALIGGSWLPFGGQNLIEACAVGTPVILGPHTFNFAQIAEMAIDAGAARRAIDIDEGMAAAASLVGDARGRSAMGLAGRAFAEAHRGATARTMEIVERLMGSRS